MNLRISTRIRTCSLCVRATLLGILLLHCPLWAQKYAYVANRGAGANSVSVIELDLSNPDFHTVTETINVGVGPTGIGITPDGTRAYVANYYSASVSVIDTDPNSPSFNTVIATITSAASSPQTTYPRDVDITSDGSRAYVSAVNWLWVIDTDPESATYNTVLQALPIGSNEIALAPDNSRAYDSHGQVIDTDPNSPTFDTVIGSVTGVYNSTGLAITPDGLLAYFVRYNTSSLEAVDIMLGSPTYNTIIGTVTGLGVSPVQIDIVPDGKRAYVTANGGIVNEVNIDPASPDYHTVTSTIQVGASPWGVQTSADGERVYVANAGSATVSVIDNDPNSPTFNTVIDTVVGLGSGPFRIAIPPDSASQDFVFRKVADTATLIPGKSFAFGAFGDASLDNGLVTFWGSGYSQDRTSRQLGIYEGRFLKADETFLVEGLVDTDTPLPSGDGHFLNLWSPSKNGGNLGFLAQGSSGGFTGLYSKGDADVEAVAVGGQSSFDGGYNTYSIYAPFTDQDATYWQSRLDTTYTWQYCYWFSGCRWESRTDTRWQGIYAKLGEQLLSVANSGTISPSIDGTSFRYFYAPASDAGRVAFGASYYNPDGLYRDGIYSRDGAANVRVVADQHTLVPDLGIPFAGFDVYSPSVDDGQTAFVGRFRTPDGAFQEGIFAESAGELISFVDTTRPVPGLDASFSHFRNPSVNRGNLAFWANFFQQSPGGKAVQNNGIFLEYNGQVRKVVATGDQLDGKDVSWLSLHKQTLEGSKVVFTAGLLQDPESRATTPAIYLAVLDSDRDGVSADEDNCPNVANSDQTDSDGGGEGDACQDTDEDLVLDIVDNCPLDKNFDQLNSDADDWGDVCDNCVDVDNPDQENIDGDGWGDACDPDKDNDTYLDETDNCPSIPNDQSDLDLDGLGDLCDSDDDGDGILDSVDGVFTAGVFSDQSSLVSDEFTDQHLGGGSFGTIQSTGGLILEISDAPDPAQGLQIDAIGGRGTASVRICGISGGQGRLKLDGGDRVILTCGSASVEALTDQVEVLLAEDDESIVITLPNAVGVKIEDVGLDEFKLSNDSLSPDDVKMTLGEVLVTVPATAVTSVMELPNGQFLIQNAPESLQPITAEVGGQTIQFNPGDLPKLPVAIDIKPGDEPNSINLGSGGNTPVAILSSSSFNATTVDPLSVSLASAPVKLKGKGTPQYSVQDVNGDGWMDLVIHIDTSALQLSETSVDAVLEGLTHELIPVRGSDTVKIVP